VHSLQLIKAAVQLDFEGLEIRPVSWLVAPTFQHDLIEKFGAFGWCRHPVSF